MTSTQLVEFAKAAYERGAKYWYGTCWYDAEESLLTRKAKQYPTHYTSGRMATYRKHIAEKRMVCDCVGLIKGFFWTGNGTHENKYKANGCPDRSANGLFGMCDKEWPLEQAPNIPGLVVWYSGHIGVYIGNGEVIEARGFKYGVVKTNVAKRPWKKAGMLPASMIVYDTIEGAEDEERSEADTLPMIRKGALGKAVERLQSILIKWNSKALPEYGIDGEFGSETRSWVKKFQKAFALEQDGIVGPLTWAVLLDVEAASDYE